MFVFDQLKRNDRPLRIVAFSLLGGMFLLLAGLWHVQIMSARASQKKQEKNSLRQISIPAVRGKILDRNGRVLADNLPRYDVVLFLEEMRAAFYQERTNAVLPEYRRQNPTNKVTSAVKSRLEEEAAYRVVSNITGKVSTFLGQPTTLDRHAFVRRYNDFTYVPFPVMANLNPKQVARFAEQLSDHPSMELQVQPVRNYPNGSAAAHLVGYVQRQRGAGGPDDFLGINGLEKKFDQQLHGAPGTNWVVINSAGYRQSEQAEVPAEPGQDLYLTIDLPIQQATEKALARCMVTDGNPVRGAAVVMDVNNGDILALASAPAFDPNGYVTGLSAADQARLEDPKYTPEFNRALLGKYPPGSTFKIITALACLESGVMDPKEQYYSEGEFKVQNGHTIHDEAPPGYYDFHRAFYKSSNTYFIFYGLKAGLAKISEVGRRFHFGEKTDPEGRQEIVGDFPRPEEIGKKWNKHQTADISIGQEITVSPVQLVSFTAAIATGGKMFWPRMVSHLKSPESGEDKLIHPPGRLRDQVRINSQHLELIHQAMLADTENPDASAYAAFHNKREGTTAFHVAGKTGTAELKSGGVKTKVTTFLSYAPFDHPRYAVVVTVEHGSFGGTSCAPAACAIYRALEKLEAPQVAKN